MTLRRRLERLEARRDDRGGVEMPDVIYLVAALPPGKDDPGPAVALTWHGSVERQKGESAAVFMARVLAGLASVAL